MKHKNKKFKKIRIISSNYRTKYIKDLKDDDGKSLDGRIWESLKEIWVRSDMNYQRILQVIMHEAIHGIEFEMPISLSNEEDRNIQITTGVTCFIRDNPEFIKEYIRVLNGR